MKRLVLGPTFELMIDGGVESAVKRLSDWIGSDGCGFEASGVGSHFQIAIRRDAGRHFWSPWLTLDVRDESAGAAVFGRFNPSPGVWTAYILGSLALITVALGAMMWGSSQLILGRTPWVFAVVPACAIFGGLMWWASAIGQRLARDEMKSMEEAVRGVLG